MSYKDVLSKGRHDSAPSPVDPPLSAEQVAALQQRFPSRVLLSREKVATASAFWLNAVIAKPLGRDVSTEVMESSLTPQWSTLGEWELFPMSYGLFIVRFSSSESRDAVLFGGPWVVSGAALAMSPFVPDFRPLPSHVTRAIIWVRLPDLPPSVWSGELISDILGVAGRVVRLDEDTELRRRGRFARAAVEVDLTHPLPPGVTVDVEGGSPPSFWQQFRYEHIHNFCNRCRRVGHRSPACTELQSSPSDAGLPEMLVRHRRSTRFNASGARDESLPFIARDESRPSVRPRAAHNRPSHMVEGPAALFGCDRSSPHVVAGPTATNPHPTRVHVLGDDKLVLAGPTLSHADVAEPSREVLPFATSAAPGLSKTGPTTSSGPSSPHLFSTSAFGPKQCEPESSLPSSSVQPGHDLRGGLDGGLAVVGVSAHDCQLIQQIMEEDSDSHSDLDDDSKYFEDDVVFTTVGKKKKNKGKFPAICLRAAPRDRTHMKRAKSSAPSASGKFSLLADLLGGMSPEDLDARHGPG